MIGEDDDDDDDDEVASGFVILEVTLFSCSFAGCFDFECCLGVETEHRLRRLAALPPLALLNLVPILSDLRSLPS